MSLLEVERAPLVARSVPRFSARHRKTIQAVYAFLLLVACGSLWGLMPSLSKLAGQAHAKPLSLALMVNAIGATALLGLCLIRDRKIIWPSWSQTRFYMVWAVLYSLLNQVAVYWLSAQTPASFVSLVTVLEGFVVFACAASMGLEKASLKRCGGLLLGLFGMAFVILPQLGSDGGITMFSLLVAGIIPITYALETVLIAYRRPTKVCTLNCVTFVMLASVLILFPFTLAVEGADSLFNSLSSFGGFAALITLATVAANFCFIQLIRVAGAVYASQYCYVLTLTGLGWSALMNGEALSPLILLAAVFVILGLWIVSDHQSSNRHRIAVNNRISAGE